MTMATSISQPPSILARCHTFAHTLPYTRIATCPSSHPIPPLPAPYPAVAFLLNRVNRYRYSLFFVFLLIPSAAIKALASKTTIVKDVEDDDEEDEE